MKAIRYLFVLPFNELSGSVVSALKLKNTIEKFNSDISVDFCCPSGSIIQPNIIIPECRSNLLDLFRVLRIVRSVHSQYSRVIFFTVRFGALSLFLKKKSILYIHEVQFGSNFIKKSINLLINNSYVDVFVVNPLMLGIYKRAKLLPNIQLSSDVHCSRLLKTHDFIMIANFSENKGIYVLLDIALSYPDFNFTLLTNENLVNPTVLRSYIASCPPNLSVCLEQEQKDMLLTRSKYLLNLSLLEETFGLTLLEALDYDAIPISFYNMGSCYCLGETAIFLDKSNPVIHFGRTLDDINVLGDTYIHNLKQNVITHFNEYVVFLMFMDLVSDRCAYENRV